VTANGGAGIAVLNSVGQIQGNIIRLNGTGVLFGFGGPQVAVTGNDISVNGWDFYNAGTVAVDGSGNYWGPTTTAELLAGAANLTKIYDQADAAGVGPLTIANWLSAPPGQGPVITQAPKGVTVAVGAQAALSVTATGTDPISYQWQKDGSSLTDGERVSGSGTSKLTISNAQIGDSGGYTVVVTNSLGGTTSAPPASVVVLLPPGIAKPPQGLSAVPGGQASFTVQTSGSAPLSYQWSKDGGPLDDSARISGAHGATLTIAQLTAGDSGGYTVAVSNPVGATNSAAAVLVVTDPDAAGTIVWQREGRGQGAVISPALSAEGAVYGRSDSNRVVALSGATGEKLWEFAAAGVVQGVSVGGGGVVYASAGSTLHALNAATGSQKWAFAAASQFLGAAAVGTNGLVYAAAASGLYAVDAATGQQRWTAAMTVLAPCWPVIGFEGSVLVVAADGVYARDGATGQPRWKAPANIGAASLAAVGEDATVFLATADGWLWALDGGSGAVRWRFAAPGGAHGSPVVGPDQTLFFIAEGASGGGAGGALFALDARSGLLKWSAALPSSSVSSPALTADGALYTVCEDGKLYGLSAADGSVKWSTAPAAGEFVGSPAVGTDGTIYAGTLGNSLYALRAKSLLAESPWPMAAQNAQHTGRARLKSSPVFIGVGPSDQTVLVGQDLIQGVVASGTPPLAYQWRKGETALTDGGRIAGVHTATLHISGVQSGDAGQYDVVVTGPSGPATSTPATISVGVPARVTAGPDNVFGRVGQAFQVAVAAEGTPPLVFLWTKDGQPVADGGRVSGAATATLQVADAALEDSGTYQVTVTNRFGSAPSRQATVQINPPGELEVLINGQPASGTVQVTPPANVSFRFDHADWFVFYSLDGQEPTENDEPYVQGRVFALNQEATVWPIAFAPDFGQWIVGDPVHVVVRGVQRVTLKPVSPVRWTDAAVALEATADSGLPVSFELKSGPATLTGAKVSFTGVGQVVVRGFQPGNDRYAPAEAFMTIEVGKGRQTIDWAGLPSRTFGDAPLALTAKASSGLPMTYSVAQGPARIEGTALLLTGAGDIRVVASQAGNDLWDAASVEQRIVAARAAQTVTFTPLADRPMTPDLIALQASASSGLPVSFVVVRGPARIENGAQLRLLSAGQVLVRAEQAGDVNYVAAAAVDHAFYVSLGAQTLLIAPDPLPDLTFGDAPLTVHAYSSAGLEPVDFFVTDGPGELQGNSLTVVGAGTIVLHARQAGTEAYGPAELEKRVSVRKASQTLTFPLLLDASYSTNLVPLLAAASSGLPVAYTVTSGNADIVGTNSLLLKNVGHVEVRAEQAGNTNYTAANVVTQSFDVVRGTQTISFKPIPDQVLGGPGVPLQAVASSGLKVVFKVISGPIELDAADAALLHLTGEGQATVRAEQVGSRLYAGAQADQSFTVRRQATLVVQAGVGGQVIKSPDQALYNPGQTVQLTAVPDSGYAFTGWSGDANGNQAQIEVVMDRSRSIQAAFSDAQAPVIVLEAGDGSATTDERFSLAGRITDNVGVASALWSYEGEGARPLSLTDGAFRVPGLLLRRGENRISVTAADSAGNVSTKLLRLTWTPQRSITAGPVAEQREGRKVVIPVQIESRGDVGGMTFVLYFDTDYLKDPDWAWGSASGLSVSAVNTNVPGQVKATFSLAGGALPSGQVLLGSLTLRVRSVPENLSTVVRLQVEDLSSPNSQSIEFGTDTQAASLSLLRRTQLGDNNGNSRLDVGDSTLVQRLITGLDLARLWDLDLNDLNQNGHLDSGDVTRLLQVVAGGATPSPLMPADEQTASGGPSPAAHVEVQWSQGPGGPAQWAGHLTVATTPSGTAALEVHPASVRSGDTLLVRVLLTNVVGSISGASFNLAYPTNALRLVDLGSHRVGPLVPVSAARVWYVAPGMTDYSAQSGRSSLAASSPTPWPESNGVLAEIEFAVQPGALARSSWELVLSGFEVTADGFENRALPNASILVGVEAATGQPLIDAEQSGFGQDGFHIVFSSQAGASHTVEWSANLETWNPLPSVVAAGPTTSVVDPGALAQRVRFYRVRVR